MAHIVFENPGDLDLRALTIFGAHAKPNSSNPIGYFGTGFKFAIATLLRQHCSIQIQSAERQLKFHTKDIDFRGKNLETIILEINTEQAPTFIELPFTLSLGKDWEVWQAYRELYSNCLDEQGTIYKSDTRPSAKPGTTQVILTGAAAESAHEQRNLIFLQGEPVADYQHISIHSLQSSTYLYYKGVRVYSSKVLPFRYTYNIKSGMTLTEDRTAQHWEVEWELRRGILQEIEEKYLLKILSSEPETFENQMLYDGEPSPNFMSACQTLLKQGFANLNENAYRFYRRRAGTNAFNIVQLTEDELVLFEAAMQICRKLKVDLQQNKITFVDNLGEGTYALCLNKEVIIDRKCFEKGVKFLALAIYEEWTHLTTGYADCTRNLQTHLFTTIIDLCAEYQQ